MMNIVFRLILIVSQLLIFLIFSSNYSGQDLTAFLFLSSLVSLFMVLDLGYGQAIQNIVYDGKLRSKILVIQISFKYICALVSKLVILLFLFYFFLKYVVLFDQSEGLISLVLISPLNLFNRFAYALGKMKTIISLQAVVSLLLLVYAHQAGQVSVNSALIIQALPALLVSLLVALRYLIIYPYTVSSGLGSLFLIRFKRFEKKVLVYFYSLVIAVFIVQADKFFAIFKYEGLDYYLFCMRFAFVFISLYAVWLQMQNFRYIEYHREGKIDEIKKLISREAVMLSILFISLSSPVYFASGWVFNYLDISIKSDVFIYALLIFYMLSRFWVDPKSMFIMYLGRPELLLPIAKLQALLTIVLSLAFFWLSDAYSLLVTAIIVMFVGLIFVEQKYRLVLNEAS
ncbi:MAG: hypothetical protein ACI9OI_000588 [Chitinophagales bacterium]|jgi:hypothetical protein